MTRHLLSLVDLTPEEFDMLFRRAAELKQRRREGVPDRPLIGRTLGLIFEKPSTRTRLSFEAAMVQLGGVPTFLSTRDLQIARSEPTRDTARVLSRYLDAVVIRTYSQELLEEFARHASIPIINALTDAYHPCQVLSDLMTVVEIKGGYHGLKYAWVGDGNNVAHSWINAAAVLGLDLTLACPAGYGPDEHVLERATSANPRIRLVEQPVDAVTGAEVIYTDVWASMGQEDQQAERRRVFAPYQVNAELVAAAAEGAVAMHCLPAHRGEEISEGVLEGPASVVWDQAENKMHMHKAVLEWLIAGR